MVILHVQACAALAGCERTCDIFIRNTPFAKAVVVILGADGPAADLWRDSGADVLCLDSEGSRTRQVMGITRLIRQHRPDAAVFWTSSRSGLLTSFAQLSGLRHVAIHVGNPITLSRRNLLAAQVYRALPRSSAATFLAVSEHVARSVRKYEVLANVPLKVVHNAVDFEKFNLAPPTFEGDDIRAGMIARLDPIKDHETLIEAWPRVVERFPAATLELVGDGPLRNGLEDRVRSLGLTSKIKFLGWIEDVPAKIGTWNVIVHATTEREGLGNAMLEAMASSRALVATDIGPVRELTQNGTCARLVSPASPDSLAAGIIDTIDDSAGTIKRIAAARQAILEHFSPKSMVNSYLETLGLQNGSRAA